MMHRIPSTARVVAAFTMAVWFAVPAAKAGVAAVKVATDKADATYAVGEKIKFLVTYLEDGKPVAGENLTYTLAGDGMKGQKGTVVSTLDPQVTFCAAMVPALCNHNGILDQHGSGWPGLLQNTRKDGMNDPNVIKTAPYFDAVYFAPRVKAQTIVQVGFLDEIAIPTAQYAMYHNLTCKKEIVNSITAGHGVPPDAVSVVYRKVDEHVKAMKTGEGR